MKPKRDAKFGEKLPFLFKMDIRNLTNFDLSTRLLNKVYIVWAEKVQRIYLSWHWRVMQIEEKLTCCLENDWNLANFHQNTWKCQNWDFDGILLSKIEKVWPWNLQRSYVSWQWRIMQNLKRNWLVIWKLIWGHSMWNQPTLPTWPTWILLIFCQVIVPIKKWKSWKFYLIMKGFKILTA